MAEQILLIVFAVSFGLIALGVFLMILVLIIDEIREWRR